MIAPESQTVEHKLSLGERREIVETCAAFATAQGGRIYIGIRDDGAVAGVQIGKGTLEALANDIAQNTVPKLVPAITTAPTAGKAVILEEPDYTDSGNVVVKIFDDRLEVSNPGGLPAGLTVADLKQPHESKPRNKLVADAFFLVKYIEQFGTGIGRMIRDCREAGVPEPEFESRAGAFRAVFRRTAPVEQRWATMGLNERQAKVVRELGAGQELRRADYQALTGASERTARRDLEDLVSRKLFVRSGRGKNATYHRPAVSPEAES